MRSLLPGSAILLAGCGAGSANIPSDLPAPKLTGGGGSAEEVAKAKGLKAPTAPTHLSRTDNPTNPTNPGP